MDKKYISQVKVDDTIYNIKDNEAARIISPEFEGIPKAPTPLNNSVTTQIATIGYVNDAFKANDAMIFKGTIGPSGATVTTLPTKHEQGWTYKVATAGSYAGQNCEVGDMIICITDGTTVNNAHWTVVQTNMTYSNTVPSDLNDTASAGSSAMVARADHVHKKPDLGNITYEGKISVTTEIANGDKILISDSSDNNIIKNSSINFDGSSEDKALTPKGTWGDFYTEPEIDEKLDEKENIIIKNASGSIAHFEDAAEGNAINVKVDFEPKQDLHGYDHPWPASGGNNLIDLNKIVAVGSGTLISIEENKVIINKSSGASGWPGARYGGNSNLLFPPGTYYIKMEIEEGAVLGDRATFGLRNSTGSFVGSIRLNTSTLTYSGTKTINEPCYFSIGLNGNSSNDPNYYDQACNLTIKNLIVSTVDVPYEPYENICPIEGYTGCNITRIGKNLLKNTNTSQTINNVTFTINQDGSVTVNGTASASIEYIYQDYYFTQRKDYILTGCPSGGESGKYRQIFRYRKDNTSLETKSEFGQGLSIPMTTQPNTTYFRIGIYIYSGYTANNLVFKPMLRLASDLDSTYEPYTETVYPISWESKAGTIYGGSLNITTGKLIITHSKVELQNLLALSGQSVWLKSSSALNGFYISRERWQIISPPNSKVLSSHFQTVNSNNEYINTYSTVYHSSSLSFNCDPAICGNTVESWEQWLIDQKNAGTPVELWYELLNPITYQLTPIEINTFLGTNNIWCDISNISIDYLVESSDKLAKYLSNKLSFDNIPTNNSYNPVYSNGIKTALNDKADNIIKNISDNPIIITDGSPTPVVDLTVKIEPIQSGNGEPSLTNIRSIFGRTKCNIIKTNKNLFPNRSYPISSNGITVNKNTDGSLKITGTATKNTYIYITNYSSSYNTGLVLPPGKYNFISGCETVNNNFRLQYSIYNNGNVVAFAKPSGYNIVQQSINEGDTIDIYIYIPENRICNDIFYPVISSNDCSIISVPWHTEAGTIYGGNLNITTGILTVDKTILTFNGSESWGTSGGGFYLSNIDDLENIDKNLKAISNLFPWNSTAKSTMANLVDGYIAYSTGSNQINIKNSTIPDIAAFTALLSTTNLQICASLITPITYQLTPIEIETLLGENTILADTGNINVSYRADTKTYIDNIKSSAENSENAIQSMITQSFENDTIATKNYNTGDLLIINNQLLRATEQIYIGSSISGKTSVVDLETIIGEKLDLHGIADSSNSVISIQLTNENLNDLLSENTTWYYASSNNSVTNSPLSAGTAFDLIVYRSASYRKQLLSASASNIWYERIYQGAKGWTEWEKINYELPIASDDTLGGIKVGQNLTIDDTGKLSSHESGIIKTTSGNPVNISDGVYASVTDLTVEIEPIQDLHGYERPYPAGGGKNLWNPEWVIEDYYLNTSGKVLTGVTGTRTIYLPVISGNIYTISMQNNTRMRIGFSDHYPIIENEVLSNPDGSDAQVKTTVPVPTGMRYLYIYCVRETDDPILILPTVQVELGSTATTYEPYSNICPISGWTGVNITRTGKNLLETAPQSYTIAGITATVNTDGSITINGTATANAVVFWNLSKSSSSSGNINDDTKYFSNGTYHKTPYDGRWAIQIRGSNSNPMTGNDAILIASYSTDTFTIDNTYAYNCAQLWVKKGSSFNNETIYPWIYKEDEYVTYPITFPTEVGTVYGGSLDVTTGVLTVTHGKVEMQDLPTLTGTVWKKSSTEGILNGYYIGSANMNRITPSDSSFLCSHFEQKDIYVDIVNGLFRSNTGVLYVMCDEALCGNTVEGFTQWLADQKTTGTPVELWYELITPVTYQLTPTEITTLLGENTISANTGIIDITYKSNIKKYIDEGLNEKLSLTGGTLTGDLTIYQESDTNTNTPARIVFKPKDTTTNKVYNNAYIAVYNDHYPTAANGTNMVLHSGGNLYIGSGESPRNLYTSKTTESGESLYITSDTIVHIQGGASNIANRVGMQISSAGNLLPEKADTLVDNSGSIGGVNNRWANLYVTNINSTTLNVTDINSNNLEAININSNIYKINNQATIQWNESDESLDFIFT